MLAPLGHVLGEARFRSLVATAGLGPAGGQRFSRPFGNGGIVDIARLGVLVDDEFGPRVDPLLEPAFETGLERPARSQIGAPVADPAMAAKKTAQVSKAPRRRLDNTRIMISPLFDVERAAWRLQRTL